MKLKMVKGPRPAQKEMVVVTSEGLFKFAGPGDVQELPDQAAHEALAKWPGCFEEAKSAPKKKKVSSEKKTVVAADYENKAASAKEEESGD